MNRKLAGVGDATLRGGLVALHAGDRRARIERVVFGVLPVVVLISQLSAVLIGRYSSAIAVDFHSAYWPAGHRVLVGGDPYAWTAGEIRDGVAFVYPAFSALFFAPFALISRGAASVLFLLICLVLTPLTLWVLQVRDWRIYGLSLVWLPVFGSWQTGNETILLVLLTALVWRHRDNALIAGVLTAAAISLKPLVWPLALWLLATRRWRACAYGLAAGLAINLVSWAVVGFGNIGVYLHDARIDSLDSWRDGYSVAAALGHLGASHSFGSVLTIVECVALAAALLYFAFFKRRERLALVLAITLMLAASPLVWSHYFALLLIPMALERPRVGWLWALPLLMWVCPASLHVHGWQEGVAWLVTGTMLVCVIRTARA
jgi:hypothetical protein